ncbi:hypothetical protein AX14_013010 [Amanita brunnescens Koide BX004]|nr:hypothetical protein AX14_013010 [Amanita brunnescens Koide BX004]
MVAALCHQYLPQALRHTMLSDESTQSSEDGSGLHSPVFGTPYPPPPGDSFRYHYDQTDVQRATTSYAPRYEYALPVGVQQLPHLSALQIPDSATHNVFPAPTYSLQSHPQPGATLHSSLSSTVRLPPSAPLGYRQLDYASRYVAPSDDVRRLPGDSIHDPPYSRPAGVPIMSSMQSIVSPVPSTQLRPESSPPNVLNSNGNSRPRKEISNVVIACNQCRSRKIRCDSKRPTCNNCARRSNLCEYDAVPKRRGPDKHPGTRQRRPKKRLLEEPAPAATNNKRRRTSTEEYLDSPTTMATNIKDDKDRAIDARSQIISGTSSIPSSSQTADGGLAVKSESPPLARDVTYDTRPTTNPYPRLHTTNPYPSTSVGSLGMPEDKKTQWSTILANNSLKSIVDAFTYLVTDAPQWFCFVNLEHLRNCLYDDEKRIHIQPAFIYSGMALSALMKSSEKGSGSGGREAAMRLASSAQSALTASLRSGQIDAKLAGAAFITSLFESSVHPSYNPDRLARALHDLDDIISAHKLTQRDASDPLATKFPAGSVPTIPETASYGRVISKRCSCLAPETPSNLRAVQAFPLPWDPTWTADEIEAEESRRLCWNALAIISIYNTLCVCHGNEPVNFWLADPGNYALLFPGEASDRVSSSFTECSQSLSPKESVWALYCRSMLLFNFCTRLVWGNLGTEDKSEYTAEALNETMSLQDSLETHSCNFDSVIIHRCRELIQNSRFIIKKATRSIIGYDDSPSKPFFSRHEAERWLEWTKRLIDQANSELSHRQHVEDKQGSMTRRPFDVTWYSTQLALCLRMWSHDRSLLSFLDVAKTVVRVVDVLNGMWPCTCESSSVLSGL